MGNCMSSKTNTEKPSQVSTTTKRTTQTIQRNNGAPIKSNTAPSKKNNSSSGKTSFQPSKGHKLSENSSTSEPDIQILSPREAAAKAAEQRLNEKSRTQGKLGNKLEQERKKSSRKHLADESEKVIQLKKVNELVYD